MLWVRVRFLYFLKKQSNLCYQCVMSTCAFFVVLKETVKSMLSIILLEFGIQHIILYVEGQTNDAQDFTKTELNMATQTRRSWCVLAITIIHLLFSWCEMTGKQCALKISCYLSAVAKLRMLYLQSRFDRFEMDIIKKTVGKILTKLKKMRYLKIILMCVYVLYIMNW